MSAQDRAVAEAWSGHCNGTMTVVRGVSHGRRRMHNNLNAIACILDLRMPHLTDHRPQQQRPQLPQPPHCMRVVLLRRLRLPLPQRRGTAAVVPRGAPLERGRPYLPGRRGLCGAVMLRQEMGPASAETQRGLFRGVGCTRWSFIVFCRAPWGLSLGSKRVPSLCSQDLCRGFSGCRLRALGFRPPNALARALAWPSV